MRIRLNPLVLREKNCTIGNWTLDLVIGSCLLPLTTTHLCYQFLATLQKTEESSAMKQLTFSLVIIIINNCVLLKEADTSGQAKPSLFTQLLCLSFCFGIIWLISLILPRSFILLPLSIIPQIASLSINLCAINVLTSLLLVSQRFRQDFWFRGCKV